ncbi:hypothetical protein H5410_052986 [Solanum commersonii]|uniref:Uncharacterized protein n=1 Tax=Solanum commersonii TaxID=4109 RepID=A0A9J5X3P8_SOLCO|nr:hypothetical protein H5410_052986 [Solanum commersonii]
MEPVGPDDQNGPFSSSNEPQSSWPWRQKRPTLKVKRSPEQTLGMEPVDPDGQLAHFQGQNEPRSCSPSFLVIQNSNVLFAEIFHKRPILDMEHVGTDVQNDPFSRSNEPRSRNFSWTSFKTLVMDPIVLDDKKGPFSSSNDP